MILLSHLRARFCGAKAFVTSDEIVIYDGLVSYFKIVSFPLKADGTPDLEHIVFDPSQARWNVPATYKVKGAATLQGQWGEVPAGGNPAYRFFKVEVVLP